MFNPFGIAFRDFLVDAEASKKCNNDSVPSPACACKCLTLLRQEDCAVSLTANQIRLFQARDVFSDGGRFDSQALGNIDWTSLASSLDQLVNQFHVIFRHLTLVGLTHIGKSFRLSFWRPVSGFVGLGPM